MINFWTKDLNKYPMQYVVCVLLFSVIYISVLVLRFSLAVSFKCYYKVIVVFEV